MGKHIDITGNRFGKLTVIGRVKAIRACGVVFRGTRWECECDCGKRILTRKEKLESGKRKSCGCSRNDHKRKPGTVSLLEYREIVSERKVDGCSVCGYNENDVALDMHHTGEKNFNISTCGRSSFPTIYEFMKELDSCIVLCSNCHRIKHFGR